MFFENELVEDPVERGGSVVFESELVDEIDLGECCHELLGEGVSEFHKFVEDFEDHVFEVDFPKDSVLRDDFEYFLADLVFVGVEILGDNQDFSQKLQPTINIRGRLNSPLLIPHDIR